MHVEHAVPSVPMGPVIVGFPPGAGERRWRRPSVQTELAWRQLPGADDGANIIASRWCDERTVPRQERTAGLANRYTVAVALRPARMKLLDGGTTVFEGTMPTGTVYVSEPGQALDASFFSPFDFIHFHVGADYLRERREAAGADPLHDGVPHSGPRRLRNLLVHDELAAQLSRTLTDDVDGGDPGYAASVGQTVLMRTLTRQLPAPRVGPLPKWRLKRVQQHLTENMAEPITLADLANAAGLSRMHFAAQFRAATGCRPHDYLLQQRIEHAKSVLANTDTPLVEVALSVGFQTQSHFSTVFKRLAGETPGRWQRARRVA